MTTLEIEYEYLEGEYRRLFNKKVLPFIRKTVKKNYQTYPVYYLLERLNINRFRSGLPIIIAKEYNINEDLIIPFSAFSELIFTTAMAQDDFYDDDYSREGVVAAHKFWEAERTLISCDYVNHKMISVLNKCMIQNKFSDAKRNMILERINDEIMLGYLSVIMEMKSKDNLFKINEKYLRKIYLNKTIHGRMLLEISFLIAGVNENLIKKIKKYGEHIAIAGQLKNDVYDFTKHKKYRGYSDLKQGHITWPLFILIKTLNNSEKKNLLKNIKEKKYKALISLFKKKRIIERVVKLIDFHVIKAKKIITACKLPPKLKQILVLWAEGNRNFSKRPKL